MFLAVLAQNFTTFRTLSLPQLRLEVFTMIFTTLDNFYVSKEDLANSPSRADGITAELERDQRIYGCELVQEACILLKLPQAVMATGQVLLHRFYCKVSLVAHDVKVRKLCVCLALSLCAHHIIMF